MHKCSLRNAIVQRKANPDTKKKKRRKRHRRKKPAHREQTEQAVTCALCQVQGKKEDSIRSDERGFAFLPWVVSAVLLLYFGRWSDAILKKTSSLRKARSYQIGGTQLFAAIAILPASFAGNLYICVASITLAVGATLAANAAYYAVIADLVPRLAGTAMGIMTMWFAAAGFLAPVITGYALEISDSFQPACWLLSVLAASSVLGVFCFHHPDKDRETISAQLA